MQKSKDKRDTFRKSPAKARLPMLLVFAVLAVIAAVLVFSIIGGKNNKTKVEYTEFISQVENGEVKKASIDGTRGIVVFEYKEKDGAYYATYPYTETFEESLLLNGVEIEDRPGEPFIKKALPYFTTLASLILIGMFAFIYFGGNKFGGTAPVSNIKTRFSDVAGLDEIKEELLSLSDMMKNKKNYSDAGARIPKGVLLLGPPGNGKTLLARAFAGEAGVNFIAVNACDFGSMFVGVGSSKVKQVFKKAKECAPCVIFIDELDAVGAKRADASDAAGKEMNTILTALLNQMDGFAPSDNVLVMAATNRMSSLDEALVRPGRFDKKFTINNPDKETRKLVFRMYTKDREVAPDVDFDRLAIRTYGYSCSSIECIVNEALIISVRAGRNFVTAQDFEDAIVQMDIQGFVKKGSVLSDNDRIITSIHEAGHAVISYLVAGDDVSTVTIRPTTSGAGGFTLSEVSEDTNLKSLRYFKNRLEVMYAGRAAEYVYQKENNRPELEVSIGASSDISQATALARMYVGFKDGIDYALFGSQTEEKMLLRVKEELDNSWNNAIVSVSEHFDIIKKVAEVLREKESLSKEEFTAIVDSFNACSNA